MKRFCVFLITGTMVIVLFYVLAILFKGIGLYIAAAIIATIFLIIGSLMLYGVLKLRSLSKDLQMIELDKIIKSYNLLSKILFSKDDINELYLYMSMVYSLKNEPENAKNYLEATSRHSMKTARMLYLYYSAYRLYYIALKDVGSYNSIANEFFNFSENLDKTIANEFLLGTELINLTELKLMRVRIEDIKDNLDLEGDNPPLIKEAYLCFLQMIKINEYIDFKKIEFQTPLFSALLDNCYNNYLKRTTRQA